MIVTSVTGHLMNFSFPIKYKNWDSCDPIDLFSVPVEKKVSEV